MPSDRHLDRMLGGRRKGRPKLEETREKLVCMIPPELLHKIQTEWLQRKQAGERIDTPSGKPRLVDIGDVVAAALRERYKGKT